MKSKNDIKYILTTMEAIRNNILSEENVFEHECDVKIANANISLLKHILEIKPLRYDYKPLSIKKMMQDMEIERLEQMIN